MTDLTFGSRLSAPAWAQKLRELATVTAGEEEVDATAHNSHIQIDLSNIRSADFMVLGRLLILAHALTRKDINVSIRMPSKELLEAEQNYLINNQPLDTPAQVVALRQISQHQRQRVACRLYIQQAGFDSAIRTGPFNKDKINIIEGVPVRSQEILGQVPAFEPEPLAPPKAPQRRRRIVSYRWIDPSKARKDQREIEDPLFRSIRRLGLSIEDTAALSKGILDELIENTREHAYPQAECIPWTLVGAELLQPQSYSNRADDFDPYMRDFVMWAENESSPLLRFFVGDSGRGVRSSTGTKPRLTPAEAGLAILNAFDHHGDYRNAERGPRGLWKVKRVVRSFRGAVLISSGPAVAGYIFDASTEGRVINTKAPSWLAGTVAECTILTASSRDIRTYDEELPSPVPALTSAASRLVSMSAILRPRIGLAYDDLNMIQKQLDYLQGTADSGLVVAIEMATEIGFPADWEMQEAIRSVLTIASAAANPATITLVFVGVSRKLLSVAIDDLNRRQDRESSLKPPGLQSPVLVVSSENIHYWAGGTPLVRHLLSRLSQSRVPHRIADIAQSLDRETARRLHREVRDQPGLLHLQGGIVTLKLRPQDAIDALTQYFSSKIVNAVSAAETPGVIGGLYLTPGLRVTSRWVNVQLLLQHLRCHRIAGFLLANTVAIRTGLILRASEPTVVRIGSIHEYLGAIFSQSLTGVDATLELTVESRTGTTLPGSGKQTITVFTDLVCSGASVRRAIRTLWDMGFSDVAVATIIDARDLERDNESADYIQVRGTQIPLSSLARVSIDADLNNFHKKPLAIDTVTNTPLPPRYPHSRTIGDQNLYIEAIKRSRAARLGHMRRLGQRHYTADINPSILFNDDIWSGATLRRMVSHITQDNAAAQNIAGKTIGVSILSATEATDDFLYVLHALARAVSEAGIDCDEPILIPRAPLGGSWAFPRIVELPDTLCHIVAIDPISRSGSTLMELIRLAARPDTAHITCFAIINGMTDLTAMGLQQIRQVASYSPHDPRSHAQECIPVSVKYMVRTAVTGSAAASCPACALREAYQSLPSTLPQSLSEHRLRLENLLAPRSRESIFNEQATDLFGVPITQDDCIAYLKWRSYLEEARFSTDSRELVVQRLTDLASAANSGQIEDENARDRDALIRLVAAEHHRLEQAPMWFTSVRAKFVAIVQSLLISRDPSVIDPMLRAQGIIVLARADVRLFAREYATILRNCKDHETVTQQALVEALWLIDHSQTFADWRTALVEQISMISRELQAEETLDSTWGAFRPTEELAYLSGLANRQSKLPPNSQQHAWSELRNFCDSVREHKYDQAMWRLQRRLENIGKGMRPASPSRVFADWEYCSSALSERVLPNLGILRGALSSDDVIERRLPAKEDRQEWYEVVNGDGARRLNEIAVIIGRAFLGTAPESMQTEELAELAIALARWSRFFFSSPATQSDPRKTSILTQIVDGCPTSLVPTLEEIFDGSAWSLEFEGLTDDDSTEVFCSATALINALTHIRMNAEVTHHQPGKAPEFGVVISDRPSGVLDVQIYNTASSPSRRTGGQGLRSVGAGLANFGGSLKVINELSGKWTYGVKIVVERWNWF